MPQYEHVKATSKGVLDSPSTLHHLSLIVALRQGEMKEKLGVNIERERNTGGFSIYNIVFYKLA